VAGSPSTSPPERGHERPLTARLRADDALPSSCEMADEEDPLCRIKLFQPGSRWTYYVCAATEYEGIEGPVLTGYCVSPLGRDCDEFGDQGLAEVARVRLGGLPPEPDLHLEPMRLSEVEAHVARHGFGP
jgi:hypothetical protein